MRFGKLSWLAALAMVVCTSQAFAQPGGDREGRERGDREGRERGERGDREGRERGERGEGRGFGNRDFRPPSNPIVEAIDKDKNGSLSAEEIKNAVAALKSLDKNGDGEISREEMRPEGFGRPGQGRPGQGGPGFGGPRPEFNAEEFTKNFVSRMLTENDKNKDGKIDKKEVTGRFAENFDRADTNSDGFIDETEMKNMAKQMAERFGQGQGRGRGDRGRGPRGEGEGRERGPRRPPVETPDDL